jgi:HAE1 family hydrophobic/amphiphilic exporter-1
MGLEDVRTPLSVATVDDPKGTIYSGTRSFTQAKDWNNIIVAYRNGGEVRVRDIGQAVTGPQDTTQTAWADGKRSIFLVIYKQPGANVIDTVDKILSKLPRIKASMPHAQKSKRIASVVDSTLSKNALKSKQRPCGHQPAAG